MTVALFDFDMLDPITKPSGDQITSLFSGSHVVKPVKDYSIVETITNNVLSATPSGTRKFQLPTSFTRNSFTVDVGNAKVKVVFGVLNNKVLCGSPVMKKKNQDKAICFSENNTFVKGDPKSGDFKLLFYLETDAGIQWFLSKTTFPVEGSAKKSSTKKRKRNEDEQLEESSNSETVLEIVEMRDRNTSELGTQDTNQNQVLLKFDPSDLQLQLNNCQRMLHKLLNENEQLIEQNKQLTEQNKQKEDQVIHFQQAEADKQRQLEQSRCKINELEETLKQKDSELEKLARKQEEDIFPYPKWALFEGEF